MNILTVSGSSQVPSTNAALLAALPAILPDHKLIHYPDLHKLPLYLASQDATPWPQPVLAWRAAVHSADAIIIASPEYLHSIPAVLKNSLEWLTTSGELLGKKVLPITYTPAAPRGAKGMQAMLWTLQALEANVLPALSLYQNEVRLEGGQLIGDTEQLEMLTYALSLLTSS